MARKSLRPASLDEFLASRDKAKKKHQKLDNSLRGGKSSLADEKPKKPVKARKSTLAEQRKLLGLDPKESDIQKALIDWAKLQRWGKRYIADYIHHSPNGGNRDPREGAKFKKMGTRAGFPDLFLPIAQGGFHGLFIEMKTATGSTTDSQEAYMPLLAEQGYQTEVCHSSLHAIQVIKDYLNI